MVSGGDDVSDGGVSGGRIHLEERSDREFAVERIHLQERLTVQEIHQREIVVDPLNAVPALPFGHLYPRWLALRSGLSENSELWSFSANWEPPWGPNEIRCGYVVVNNGLPGSYILTVRKRLEDPA